MGILRTDRVSGLGGANAIKGSVFFGNCLSAGSALGFNYLRTESSDNFTFGTGDITIEGWFFFPRLSSSTGYQTLVGDTIYSNTGGFTFYVQNAQLNFWKGTNASSVVSGGTIVQNEWTHLAYTRESGSNKIFVNGSLVGTASDSTEYTDTTLTIGTNKVTQQSNVDAGLYSFSGFVSNLRILKGRALYTAAFTPPVGELQVIDNTVLLCCQSPGNVLQEATGVTLTAPKVNNSAGVQASHFTPNSPVGFSTTSDVGTQFGSTFDGVTTFDSQAYFVPPGGNTRERNRGRAVFGGGATPSVNKTIDYVHIPSGGNAIDFGDKLTNDNSNYGLSNSIRGLWAGGRQPTASNVIEFVTLANTANTIDFGDLTEARLHGASVSNSTRGIFMSGGTPTATNVMDFVTIATTGNAQDFGDTLTAGFTNGGGRSSSTRGIRAGNGTPAAENVIEFITIATTGNGQNFGDLTQASRALGAGNVSNGTRAVLMGGYTVPAFTNVMSFITIASAGDAQDFGDISSVRGGGGTASTITRGILAGGRTPTDVNTIDAITIATTGNSTDFGDLTLARAFQPSGCSDSHGGLS